MVQAKTNKDDASANVGHEAQLCQYGTPPTDNANFTSSDGRHYRDCTTDLLTVA